MPRPSLLLSYRPEEPSGWYRGRQENFTHSPLGQLCHHFAIKRWGGCPKMTFHFDFSFISFSTSGNVRLNTFKLSKENFLQRFRFFYFQKHVRRWRWAENFGKEGHWRGSKIQHTFQPTWAGEQVWSFSDIFLGHLPMAKFFFVGDEGCCWIDRR